jgi:DNA polymerase-4
MEAAKYIHCDNDNYFASVEEKFNPSLKNIPFAVCGDPEMRHSVVMSKNSLAKRAGVPTGISFRQAKQICPNLAYVKADMGKYLEQTKLTRGVYFKYTDTVIPYGMDESWISIGAVSFHEAAQIADLIRIEIMYSLGLSASLGVSFNRIFSKIGSDYRKPNSVTIITPQNYRDIIWMLPVSDLLFVGIKRKQVFNAAGIYTIGDVARSDPARLVKLVGKAGYDLWCYANGDDSTFKPNSDHIGSIGNTITPPADLRSNEDVSAIIYLLASTVCARLKKHKLKTGCVSITMRDNSFNRYTRQNKLQINTDNVNYVFNSAYGLFTKHYKWERPLRSIGVRADNLESMEQLSLYPYDECELNFDIDSRIKNLTDRLGILKVEKSAAIKGCWECADDIPS